MSLQLVSMATVIACATASMDGEVSSSKYAKWTEQNKVTDYMKMLSPTEQINSSSATEQIKSSSSVEEKHNKESCAVPSSSLEQDKAKTTTFRPRWSIEEMDGREDFLPLPWAATTERNSGEAAVLWRMTALHLLQRSFPLRRVKRQRPLRQSSGDDGELIKWIAWLSNGGRRPCFSEQASWAVAAYEIWHPLFASFRRSRDELLLLKHKESIPHIEVQT